MYVGGGGGGEYNFFFQRSKLVTIGQSWPAEQCHRRLVIGEGAGHSPHPWHDGWTTRSASFVQVTGTIGGYSIMRAMPPQIKTFVSIQKETSSVISPQLFSLNCLWYDVTGSWDYTYFEEFLLFEVGLPGISLIFCVIVALLVRWNFRRVTKSYLKQKQALETAIAEKAAAGQPHVQESEKLGNLTKPTPIPMWQLLIATMVIVLFFIYAMLIEKCSLMFQCTTISYGETSRRWLGIDPSISCDEAQYKQMQPLAIFFFLMYGFGIPGAVVLIIKVHPLPP